MKKKYVWIITIVSTIFIVIGSIYLYVHYTVKKYETTFYPNVKIEGIDLTSTSKQNGEEALANLTNTYDQIKVTVSVGNQTYQKQLKDIGASYNSEKQITEAFQFGKNEKLFKQFSLIQEKKGKDFSLTYSIDENKLNHWITSIEKEMKKDPKNATISIRNGNINITNDIKGSEIDQKQLQQSLVAALQTNNKKNIAVTANLKEVLAPITTEKLNSIRTKIGTFTTHYSTGDFNRNTNIKLATQTIDSYLLMPGESFSFNNYVGDTTADKGYKAAGSFLDGEIVDSLGGGVCQVSTTLYNAIIKAGIIPDKRYNHSMTVGYVPIGQDAAIAYPYKDLIFTNPYDRPVYIEGTVSPSSVTFTVYSSSESKPANIEYRLSSSIVKKDTQATKSVTYFETITDGKVTDRKRISRDSYAAKK